MRADLNDRQSAPQKDLGVFDRETVRVTRPREPPKTDKSIDGVPEKGIWSNRDR